jgi:hypothetical protein
MEQIIVTRIDGSGVKSKILLQSKSNVSKITKAEHKSEINGADTVDISVESAKHISFTIGDKIDLWGIDYTLNIPAKERKISESHFVFDLQFEGPRYDLLRCMYNVNVDTTGNIVKELTGNTLTGDMKMFLDVLIMNANRVFGGKWSIGNYPQNTETKTLTFGDSDTCLSVLQTLCGDVNYDTEFSIDVDSNGNRILNIGMLGTEFGYIFEYGKGKGLYELTREKSSDSNIVNKLFVYGGSKNVIAPKYGYDKLLLPESDSSKIIPAYSQVGYTILSYTGQVTREYDGSNTHTVRTYVIQDGQKVKIKGSLTSNDVMAYAFYNMSNVVGIGPNVFGTVNIDTVVDIPAGANRLRILEKTDTPRSINAYYSRKKGNSYISDEDSISNYGVWEGVKIFEDVFPSRVGVVTSTSDNELQFVDSTIDFDLNAKDGDEWLYRLVGSNSVCKVNFTSGKLSGFEFEVSAYDTQQKKFTIRSYADQNNYTFPSNNNEEFKIAVGDKYVITDIYQPESYITSAENVLLSKATEYLSKFSNPRIQYSLIIDQMFLKKFTNSLSGFVFNNGDYIHVKDNDLRVDTLIRIKSFSRDLIHEYSYNLTIDNVKGQPSTTVRTISDVKTINTVVKMNDLNNPAKARQNYKSSQEVINMLYDQDGYFTPPIKPLSIETTMLSVGAKSQQFALSNTLFQPNYLGAKNRIVYKGGVLVHYAVLDNSGNPKIWTISDGDLTLQSDSAYYIYAKCSRSAGTAIMVFSLTPIMTESDGSNYNFLVGVVNSVDSATNTRLIALTYGGTTINGRYMRTGRIQSTDGSTYFDLDSGELVGDIKFKSGVDAKQAIIDANAAAASAVSTANSASSTASSAQSTANSAQSTANSAQSTANTANSTANDAQAQAQALEYLKYALEGSTDISGGLLATNVLLMKTALGAITGGMSGLNSDNIGMWTGGTYAEALSNVAKTILRKDGSGQLAGGKINWDDSGSMNVGLFNIFSNLLSSGNISFTSDALEDLSAIPGSTVNVSLPASKTANTASGYTNTITSNTFTASKLSLLKFRVSQSIYMAQAGYVTLITKVIDNATGTAIFTTNNSSSSSIGTFSNNYDQSYNIPAGTYYIEITLSVTNSNSSNYQTVSVNGYGGSGSYITISPIAALTKIANDGFYSYWGASAYLYLRTDFGFQVMFGNYGIQCTTGGLKKTSNGGSSWALI